MYIWKVEIKFVIDVYMMKCLCAPTFSGQSFQKSLKLEVLPGFKLCFYKGWERFSICSINIFAPYKIVSENEIRLTIVHFFYLLKRIKIFELMETIDFPKLYTYFWNSKMIFQTAVSNFYYVSASYKNIKLKKYRFFHHVSNNPTIFVHFFLMNVEKWALNLMYRVHCNVKKYDIYFDVGYTNENFRSRNRIKIIEM